MKRLTYCEVQTPIDVQFWNALREKKLLDWKLDEPVVPIHGYLVINPAARHTLESGSHGVYFRSSSLDGAGGSLSTTEQIVFECAVPGYLQNFNTLSGLRSQITKHAVFSSMYRALLAPLLIMDHSSVQEEEKAWLHAPFALLSMFTFVDAKSYLFYHCESLPAFTLHSPIYISSSSVGAAGRPFSDVAADQIRAYAFQHLREHRVSVCSPFIAITDGGGSVCCLPFTISQLVALQDVNRTAIICFHDFSEVPCSLCWPMRNFLVCVRLAAPALNAFRLYAVRSEGVEHSLYLECQAAGIDSSVTSVLQSLRGRSDSNNANDSVMQQWPFLNIIGWRQKQMGRVDLSNMLNPSLRADTDSRFNLELMRWRVLPSLELSRLAQCKALLLGTGTLGCNVARNLLTWGVRHITLVDRGTVSYSNLGRQSLFTAEDAAKRSFKTEAAARSLKAIIPTADITPVTVTIHMPGHRTNPERVEETMAEVRLLDELIQAHDLVFLLTDSREARWVPTVMAAAHGIPVMNVALGYDTYVVMRHGIRSLPSTSNLVLAEALPSKDDDSSKRATVSCYFCSDVVAPTDSISGRTLDQQCTVTRPAVSTIASAIAVELIAQLYQHADGFCCAPYRAGASGCKDEGCEGVSRLGVIPQQIRGSVYGHSMFHLYGERNANCTACADGVLTEYRRRGAEFVVDCMNNPTYIEEVCGVKALKERWEAEMDVLSASVSSSGST